MAGEIGAVPNFGDYNKYGQVAQTDTNQTNTLQQDPLQQAQAAAATQTVPPELQQFQADNIQAYQQPQADTFQKSGPGLGTALTLGALGGAATGGGIYLWGAKPVDSDGNFKESFIRKADSDGIKANTEAIYKEALAEAKAPTLAKYGIADEKAFEAVEKLAKGETLTDEMKALIPSGMDTEKAKNAVKEANEEFAKIDKNALLKAAEKEAKVFSLSGAESQLKDLKTIESKVTALADDIKTEDLKKFIEKNKELFHLEGTDAEVAKQVEDFTNLGKKGLLDTTKTNITSYEEGIKSGKATIQTELKSAYDTSKNAFKEGAEYEQLAKTLKSYKLNQALKTGGIVAGVTALALGIMFAIGGGKKEAPQNQQYNV